MRYLDTRELVERRNDLQDEKDVFDERIGRQVQLFPDFVMDTDALQELGALIELLEEIGESSVEAGVTLIPDPEFEDYARQFAEDIGAVTGEERWPLSHIDWAAAAEDLQSDYSSISFRGIDYWYRGE